MSSRGSDRRAPRRGGLAAGAGARAARSVLLLVAALLCGAAGRPAAAEGAWPARGLKLIVPFPAGGSADFLGRILARRLAEDFGQPVVVENRAGAGGTIGIDAVAKAPADGYTIGFGTVSTLALAPSTYSRLPYDPVNGLAPIGQVAVAPVLLAVGSAVPARSVRELVELARQHPGTLNYASIGNGTLHHFAGETFRQITGAEIVHVPYKGAAPALVALLSGEVQILIDQLASFQVQNFQSGRLRALLVTGTARLSQLPEVPTAAEAGIPGFDISTWFGIVAPRGIPAEAAQRLNASLRQAVATPELRSAFAAQGVEASGGSAEQFAHLIAEENIRWAKLVRAIGFKAEP